MVTRREKAKDGAARLRGLTFFEGFSDADLDRVGQLADDLDVEPGTCIIDQGRVGQECWVVERGEVGVYVGDEHIVSLGAGAMIGEMALVDRRPRTASVIAETPVTLLVFDTKAFRKLLSEMPMAEERVLSLLASRLKANESRS